MYERSCIKNSMIFHSEKLKSLTQKNKWVHENVFLYPLADIGWKKKQIITSSFHFIRIFHLHLHVWPIRTVFLSLSLSPLLSHALIIINSINTQTHAPSFPLHTPTFYQIDVNPFIYVNQYCYTCIHADNTRQILTHSSNHSLTLTHTHIYI